jgi:hypothetical protein
VDGVADDIERAIFDRAVLLAYSAFRVVPKRFDLLCCYFGHVMIGPLRQRREEPIIGLGLRSCGFKPRGFGLPG